MPKGRHQALQMAPAWQSEEPKGAGGRGHMKNPMNSKIKILCVRPDEKPDEKPAENLNVLVKRADEKPG